MKLYTSSKTSEDIYCFDIQKEIERKEDWTNSKEQIKEHTNILLYGGTYDKVEFKGLIDTIFKNKKIGFIGSILYTFSIYRKDNNK